MKNNKTYSKPRIVCVPKTTQPTQDTINEQLPPVKEVIPATSEELTTDNNKDEIIPPIDVPEMSIGDFLTATKGFQGGKTVERLETVLTVPLDYNASEAFGKSNTPPIKTPKQVQQSPHKPITKTSNPNFMDRIIERTSQLLADKIYNS